ncbi:Uma2 family endonuclease [Leptolyngbya sp. CCNP1308]|uniref:Uma2 family endonuclease n=1 Tax=Leptolyngbya sp. CCNP1308 TaxID=3110255 RepID=UPI002B1FDA89|nr:Uma2 family endonuclease [Leptolyngbya sp. CCNP1308]MEA5450173.1 Uma2 family endonuclease [Leptolyngbya sp. CCNP1308]
MTALWPQATLTYPSSDGEPVAETYTHLYALLITLEALRQYVAGRQATVLGNQFLYYAQGFPKLRVAPDVMVIFEVEPGGRDNYKIWEEGQVPAVIFEMTSAGTRRQDEVEKKTLYEGLGVQEYWLFDLKGEWIAEQLKGYRLRDEIYEPIRDSCSEPLGLRLEVDGGLIAFYRQDTGEKLLIPDELAAALRQETLLRQQAEQRAAAAERELEELKARLRDRGINPDDLIG